ncbi:MAG: hypothetical protein H7A32_05520 [Deltaproteobacteria bacterium]|nr:hypothetical protein [Deltaproteobacteria bacterium]
MNRILKLKAHFIPIFLLVLPASFGLGVEVYNLYFRGMSTPFLWISVTLFLLSMFFWIRQTWLYVFLLLFLGAFLFYYLQFIAADSLAPKSSVYYYQRGYLNTQNGRLVLKKPLGKYPPQEGPYLACYFRIFEWKQYLNLQPRMCTGFDKSLRVNFSLNDQLAPEGRIREIQINDYHIERKSLLGEKLDRGALQLSYLSTEEKIWRNFRLQSTYEAYEREYQKNRFRVVESISRDAQGKIKRITESPLEVYSRPDQFANYGPNGKLKNAPKNQLKPFVFPKQIELKVYNNKGLPSRLKPGEIL